MVKSGSILVFYHFGNGLYLVYYHPLLGCDLFGSFSLKVATCPDWVSFGFSKIQETRSRAHALMSECRLPPRREADGSQVGDGKPFHLTRK